MARNNKKTKWITHLLGQTKASPCAYDPDVLGAVQRHLTLPRGWWLEWSDACGVPGARINVFTKDGLDYASEGDVEHARAVVSQIECFLAGYREARREPGSDLPFLEKLEQRFYEGKLREPTPDLDLHAQFKADVLAEVGLTNHPKAEMAFNIASRDGQTFAQTFDELRELAGLLR